MDEFSIESVENAGGSFKRFRSLRRVLARSDGSLNIGMGALGCGERFREAAKLAISFRIVEGGEELIMSQVISEDEWASSCFINRGDEKC